MGPNSALKELGHLPGCAVWSHYMTACPVTFSILSNRFDNSPVIVGELSPSQLVEELVNRTRLDASSKDGPGFMLTSFSGRPLRRFESVDLATALVLDVDQGKPLEEVLQRLDALDLAYISYTTFFHGRIKNPGEAREEPAQDRARLIVFLTEPVPASEYSAWLSRAADFLVGPDSWDPTSRDAAHLHYLPAHPPGVEGVLVSRIGDDRRALDPWRDVPPAFPNNNIRESVEFERSDLPKPWEAFSAASGIEDLLAMLEGVGYHSRHSDSRTGGYQLCRPGKKAAEGRSVSVWPGDARGPIVKVFSSNCQPLNEKEVYDAFGLLVALEHRGDVKGATRAASAWLDSRGIGHAKTQDRIQVRTDQTKRRAESPADRRLRAAAFLTEHAKTPNELFNLPDDSRDFVVEGLLPSAGLCLLAAKPKVGKSTLARHLALAVATGEDVLGRKVKQGTVVYLALEEKPGEVRDHFRRMGLPEDAPLITVCFPAGDLGLDLIEEVIEKYRPTLVIIDPIFKLVRVSDTSDYAELTNKLEGLLTLARVSGASILAVHHARKGIANEQDTDAVLGSTGLSGAVDNLMILGRDRGERTIETIQRYGTELPRTRLQLGEDGRSILGHEVSVERRARAEEVVFGFIEANPGSTSADLRDRTEMRNEDRSAALKGLLEVDRITRSGKGGKGDPYRFFVRSERADDVAVPYPPSISAEQGTESPASKDQFDEPIQMASVNGSGDQQKRFIE